MHTLTTTLLLAGSALAQSPPPTVTIDRDNVEIAQSCRIVIGRTPIIDADGNGVIHITASDISVEFAPDSPALHGANADQLPDSFAGKGIVITGRNVTLRGGEGGGEGGEGGGRGEGGGGAKISGYKVGIHAIKADGLTIHDVDVSNNFHQRLKSTPAAEDGGDWLWPHNNDDNQWITNYGAGLCVEDSSNVTIHRIRARRTQNGIILDAVNDSQVYDCDCSFLSGWGLALWRSNRNVITRNAFDFCIRGYSHGVYNRGQDSAGILMFEQCSENIIAENSATHGGDGLFAFAGREALGEANPRDDVEWHKRRGNNDNLFAHNDLSFAAAHGLELTFSFGNRISGNTFRENAICGIWGGYSQSTSISQNIFRGNGEGAYGLERGGINIEHGRDNLILLNHFQDNRCGVHLWWDDDKSLHALPWSRANLPDAGTVRPAAMLNENEFRGDQVALHLRHLDRPVLLARNAFHDVPEATRIEGPSTAADDPADFRFIEKAVPQKNEILGTRDMRGHRAHLAGRDKIIMTEWGPWDHASPLLQYTEHFDTADVYRLRGAKRMPAPDAIAVEGEATVRIERDLFAVLPRDADTIAPYRISFEVDGHRLSASGLLTGGSWSVLSFPSSVDPREDADKWREDGVAKARRLKVDALDLRFGSGGMSEALQMPVRQPGDPRDHFGTIATRTLTFPPGRWRIRTLSDDGIRLWLDDQLVIDDWTHHAPRRHDHEFTVDQPRTVALRVEHFELDGFAVLSVTFEHAVGE